MVLAKNSLLVYISGENDRWVSGSFGRQQQNFRDACGDTVGKPGAASGDIANAVRAFESAGPMTLIGNLLMIEAVDARDWTGCEQATGNFAAEPGFDVGPDEWVAK